MRGALVSTRYGPHSTLRKFGSSYSGNGSNAAPVRPGTPTPDRNVRHIVRPGTGGAGRYPLRLGRHVTAIGQRVETPAVVRAHQLIALHPANGKTRTAMRTAVFPGVYSPSALRQSARSWLISCAANTWHRNQSAQCRNREPVIRNTGSINQFPINDSQHRQPSMLTMLVDKISENIGRCQRPIVTQGHQYEQAFGQSRRAEHARAPSAVWTRDPVTIKSASLPGARLPI